jgi:hypothetical protein
MASVQRAPLGGDFTHIPIRSVAVAVGGPGDGGGRRSSRSLAERGTAGGGAGLPHLAAIQRSFGGHDVGGASAHHGRRAAAAAFALGARAFTFGDRVAFAGPPDLRTAAHEATHVVQQRAGVRVSGDVGRAGDVYERHAESVADRVVRGQSAEALLDELAPRRSRALGMRRQVLQRAPIETNFGKFDTTKYDAVGPAGSEYGVDIVLTFDPDTTKADAKKIGLTQTARSVLAGAAVALRPSQRGRIVSSGTGEGRQIDRIASGPYANPLYAAAAPGATDKLETTPTVPGWGQHGSNYKNDKGKAVHEPAKLIDTPTLPGHGKNAGQTFETAALAVEGAQSGTYMGSVSWGWQSDAAAKFTKLPLTLVSKGDPSADFVAAAKQWNAWTTAGTIKTTPDPTNVYDATYSVAFTVAKDTEVEIAGGPIVHDDAIYNPVTIKAGPDVGKSGRILGTHLRDVGGGRSTIDLPIPAATTGTPALPSRNRFSDMCVR